MVLQHPLWHLMRDLITRRPASWQPRLHNNLDLDRAMLFEKIMAQLFRLLLQEKSPPTPPSYQPCNHLPVGAACVNGVSIHDTPEGDLRIASIISSNRGVCFRSVASSSNDVVRIPSSWYPFLQKPEFIHLWRNLTFLTNWNFPGDMFGCGQCI